MTTRRKFTQILIVVAIMLGLIGPAALFGGAQSLHAHPSLVELGLAAPQQVVSVIVQKADETEHAEELTKVLGGVITHELSIINAFAAQMEARNALALAASPSVRWVSLDAPVERSGKPTPPPSTLNTNTYLDTLGVRNIWSMGRDGSGIGVAVIDSGVSNRQDLPLQRSATFNPTSTSVQDYFGHGTHVAGILSNNGVLSNGQYAGVAPGITLVSLKVSNEAGMAYESDVVAAMQWVYDNKSQYNIHVVNVSLNSTVEQSYHTSPLAAACEILWFNGVVVVASVGNTTETTPINLINTAPSNDPFIIVVGAADELGTTSFSDDKIATFSAYGITQDGFIKPDIFAPGANIISALSDFSGWDMLYPERLVNDTFYRLSGTSMAAPMVSGAAALLLQDEPSLTPDQVKYRLMNATSRKFSQKVGRNTYSIPYLDVYAAVTGETTQSANTGLTASQLLWTGSTPVTWSSVAWNSVAWNSVAWNSVAWNSVAWNSVAWNSVYWGP